MTSFFGGSKKKEEKKEEDAAAEADAAATVEVTKDDKGSGAVCQMKRGDYMIHVYIEQCKNLKVDAGDTVDPMVEITCLGEKKYTSAQKGIDNVSPALWNEHVFFEPKNVEAETMNEGKIEIKLLDKGFFKDAIIGFYEFDISYIYLMKDHALMHKWVIMSNPESDDFGEVTGYLKLSITVCGVGDEQVAITEDSNPNEDDVIQPPQVKPEFYQMYIRFFAGQKIVPMDGGYLKKPKIDAYVQLQYKTKKLKTKVLVQEEGGTVHWNQEFLIPAQIPIMGGKLGFKVFDEDITSDDVVGAFSLTTKDIIGAKNGMFFWKNIYGAPMGYKNSAAQAMNENPEVASFWKGRILMQVLAVKSDKPLLKVQDIKPEDVEKARPHLLDKKFNIMVQVNAAIALPEENVKYEVVVRIGEHEIKTGPPPFNKGRYNRYNYRTIAPGSKDSKPETDKVVVFNAPYINISDMGSVFVYLRGKTGMTGSEQNICYYRGRADKFTDKDPGIKWIEFLPDPSINDVQESHKAGLCGIRISIHNVTESGPYTWDKGIWNTRMAKRPGNLKARAYIYQCRDLPSADSDGTSDPFIVITDSDIPQRTVTIEDNVNPIFYQALDMMYEANSIDEMPPFIIDCYDEDPGVLGSKPTADFLNRAVIPVKNIKFSQDNTILRPEWYDLRLNSKSPSSGQILMSFAIVVDDFSFARSLNNVHLEEQVDMQEFQVSLNVLGLRSLQSPGILPVKKAFINFNLKSLVPPSMGTNLQNLKTEPKQAGPDPTINTLMTFNVPLPLDPLFCPRLSCQVYDQIFAGFSQPLIGVFTIPVGELIQSLREERQTETAALVKVVSQLKKIAEGQMVQSFYIAAAKYKVEVGGIIDEEDETSAEDPITQRIKEAQNERLSDGQKKKLVDAFSKKDGSASINDDEADQPLLIGDSNEEQRLKPMLDEKNSATLNGKLIRMNQDQIEEKERSLSQGSAGMLTSPSQGARKKTMFNKTGNEVNPKLKAALMIEEKERVEKAKRQAEDQRLRENLRFQKESNINTAANVIMPKYKRDIQLDIDRESEAPPESLFLGLGWDEDATTKKRHYRRYYPDELEKVKSVLPVESPFQSYNIKRGQSRGAKAGFWASLTNTVKTDASGAVSSEQVMGEFKAVIEVEIKEEKKLYLQKKQELFHELLDALQKLSDFKELGKLELDLDKLETMEGREELEVQMEPLGVRHLKITKILADIQSDVILQKMLLHTNQVIVRAYMISGYDLASRDIGGFSDPYLILTIGDKTFNERDSYVLDQPNPDFHKHYDFEQTFPGCPQLTIQAMDYDDLFGDDLIGTTTVDLEDRYFMPEWRAINDKPIEYRQIYHPSSGVSQGVLKMWVEINPAKVAKDLEEPLWDIKPKPPYEMEIRLCVFDTKEIKMMDAEGTSDVFIKAFFDNKNALETDTHFRCQNGKASFNYRLKFNEVFPRKDYRLQIQAYDRDFFKSNDIIGSSIIDLKQAFEDVCLTRRPLGVNKTYFDLYMRKNGMDFEFKDDSTFWLPMKSKNDKGELENNGFVRVQIDIVPKDYAEANNVGSAREEPNANPFLPPPIGRLSFSLNPCKMYEQLVGPAMRRKICIYGCCAICCILCLALFLYMIPTIIGTLISNKIASWF